MKRVTLRVRDGSERPVTGEGSAAVVLKVSRHCCWRERCLRGAHACKLKVEAYKKQAFPETFSERVSQVGVAE